MLKNYLVTFLRVLVREKLYSFLNIMGLALGLTAALTIALYISDELSYDRFNRDADRIFRVGIYVHFSGKESKHASSGAPVAEALQQYFPEIESTHRLRLWTNTRVSLADDAVNLKQVIVADSNFFNFFTFRLLEGNPNTALTGKNKIVLTESAAKALLNYDGKKSPLGQLLLVSDDKTPMEVTGIAADPHSNSHFHFNALISFSSIEPLKEWFVGTSSYNYFKVRKAGDELKIQERFLPFSYKCVEPEIVKIAGRPLKDIFSSGEDLHFFFQPLLDIHLRAHHLSEIEPNGDESVLYLMGGICACIVLLACINFVNLITARSIKRAKEVGIRKTMGAMRLRLIKQFMIESLLYTSISTVMAITLLSLALTPFNLLVGKSLSTDLLTTPGFIIAILSLIVLVTSLSGIYPAFYVTSVNPSQAISGTTSSGVRRFDIRSSLVMLQFVISMVMLIGTMSVYQQITFLLDRNPGFDSENIICLNGARHLKGNAEAFKNELLQESDIIAASYCSDVPTDILSSGGFRRKNNEHWHTMLFYWTDEQHEKTMGFTVTKGRFFSKEIPSDTMAVVLNETAARMLGIDDLNEATPFEDSGNETYNVLGIVKDFNFESAKSDIKPLVIYYYSEEINKMVVRIRPGRLNEKLEHIRELWSRYADSPLEFSFMNDNLQLQYESEVRLRKVTIILTLLAIVIACLGLFGLVTYIAAQRKKEIGIRKILGASIGNVVIILSNHFSKLLVAAICISLPLSWYLVNQWLDTFAVRTNFDFLISIWSALIVAGLALVTISYQAIKAALTNPVESLRGE